MIENETSRELDARWAGLNFEEWVAASRARGKVAAAMLRPMLKEEDRLRATAARCGAHEASFTFSHWEGGWMMSKSRVDIAPGTVYSVNGEVLRVSYDPSTEKVEPRRPVPPPVRSDPPEGFDRWDEVPFD